MARDGSGTYTRTDGFLTGANICETTKSTGVGAVAARFDTMFNDMASEITDSLSRSGDGGMLADLNMGTHRVVNVVNPANSQDAVTLNFLQRRAGPYWCGTTGGSATAYTVTPLPAFTAYEAGMVLSFLPGSTNTSAIGTTLDVNSLGTQLITTESGLNITPGMLRQGVPAIVFYGGSSFQIVNPCYVWQQYTPTVDIHPTLGVGGLSGSPTTRLFYLVQDRTVRVRGWVRANLSGGNTSGVRISLPIATSAQVGSALASPTADSPDAAGLATLFDAGALSGGSGTWTRAMCFDTTTTAFIPNQDFGSGPRFYVNLEYQRA